MHFVLFLKQVKVSNPQRLTYTQIIQEALENIYSLSNKI